MGKFDPTLRLDVFFTYFSLSSMTLDCNKSSSLRNFSTFILAALLKLSTVEEVDEAMESLCSLDLVSTFSVVKPNTQPGK